MTLGAAGQSGDTTFTHITVAILIACAVALGFVVAAMIVQPRWRRIIPRVVAVVLGGLLAVYFVARGIAEFWTVDYSDPASYRNDWGGPSLLGVFAVHSGPGFVIVVAALVWLYRRASRRNVKAERAT